MNYQRKPEIVEAIQWKGTKESFDELKEFGVSINHDEGMLCEVPNYDYNRCIFVYLGHDDKYGWSHSMSDLFVGNYILRNSDTGELNIMSEERFLKQYEEV